MTEQTQMLNYVDAINSAYREEMRRDENVVMFGEDLITMRGSANETTGIYEEFGPDRIKDTPITEQAIVGMAMGAGMAGLRPIGFLMFASLIMCCCDQLFLKLGCNRQEWGYRGPLPVVIYTTLAAGDSGESHGTQPEALLVHCPGLKVVVPSTPYDAKGLMKSAIRDDEPVIYFAHRGSYFAEKQAIPTEEYLVPIGKADVKREGKDITIVSYSAMVHKVLAAAEELAKEGVDAEVVDLRSLVPLDIDAVVKSVKKTGRLLITHEARKRGGVAAEIVCRFIEAAPDLVQTMKAPIKRLATKNVVFTRRAKLGPLFVPQAKDVVAAVKEMV